ncbi:MAG: tetratricopeptide repeat protein [Bryobacterales bacterium]|nr:tetratricopeptide repeat protein [Bryobacterales bacterium]
MALSAFPQQPEPAIESIAADARRQMAKGEFDAARQSMEQAWKLAGALPREDVRRYNTLKHFVAVLTGLAEYEEAETYLNLAIHWRETVKGPADEKIPDELMQMAHLHRLRGDFQGAMEILQRVLLMRTRTKGFESIEVADLLSLQALVCIEQQENIQAVAFLRQSLLLRGKLLGEDHPTLVPDLDRMGAMQATMRNYAESETAFRRVLLIREAMLGKDDPDLLATLDGLAYALFGQKKHPEAEAVYLRLLDLWVKTSGPEHPMVAWAYDKLAILYQDQKDESKRKPAADNANAVRAIVLGKGLLAEATTQAASGDRVAALELLKQAQQALLMKHQRLEPLRKQIDDLLKQLAAPPKTKKSAGNI